MTYILEKKQFFKEPIFNVLKSLFVLLLKKSLFVLVVSLVVV